MDKPKIKFYVWHEDEYAMDSFVRGIKHHLDCEIETIVLNTQSQVKASQTVGAVLVFDGIDFRVIKKVLEIYGESSVPILLIATGPFAAQNRPQNLHVLPAGQVPSEVAEKLRKLMKL